jgi:hypothetical protein
MGVCPDQEAVKRLMGVCPDQEAVKRLMGVCPDQEAVKRLMGVCPDQEAVKRLIGVCPDQEAVKRLIGVCPDQEAVKRGQRPAPIRVRVLGKEPRCSGQAGALSWPGSRAVLPKKQNPETAAWPYFRRGCTLTAPARSTPRRMQDEILPRPAKSASARG